MKTVFAMIALSLLSFASATPLLSGVPAIGGTELAWDSNPAKERVSFYIVYEKIETPHKPPIWKKIGVAHQPKFRVSNLTPGLHTFAVSAVGIDGESPRSGDLKVTVSVNATSERTVKAESTKSL